MAKTKEMKRFLGSLAALAFLGGAELEVLLHGELFPSPYVIIGAIVVGVVVGYVVYFTVPGVRER